MVGTQKPRQYEFSLGVVSVPDSPARRQLVRVAERIDFEFVRAWVAPYFSAIGRPSVDPVVMVKMMLLGYLFGIESDRALVGECADRLSFREFLGLNVSDPLPTHPCFTHWRQRLGPELFRELLHEIVRQIVAHGMVLSEARTIDATTVKAQADEHGPVLPVPAGEDDAAVRRHVEGVFADAVPEVPDDQPWMPVNLHDADARLQRKDGEPAEFGYQTSFCADPESGLITDATATPTERPSTMVDHLAHDPFPVSEVVADSRYDAGDSLADVQSRGVRTYVPKIDRDKPGQLSKDWFTYDPQADCYWCPAGHCLRYAGFNRHSQLHQYVARKTDCAVCALKPRCTQSQRRMVTRTVNEAARERTLRGGRRYQELMGRRRVNEHLNGLAKRDHGLRRARSLGLAAMRIQAAWTAIAINILKLVRWRPRRGPGAAFALCFARLLGALCAPHRRPPRQEPSEATPGGHRGRRLRLGRPDRLSITAGTAGLL